ncbi:MAG: VWA domain-containing protein [Saprospiraceae bacterium]
MKTRKLSFLLLSILFFAVSCHNNSRNYSAPTDNLSFPETSYFVEEEAPIHSDETNLQTEEYDIIRENEFLEAQQQPLSTFSIDVDNASYSNIRRYLDYQLPPVDAVRIEEMINYFTYDYPQPKGEHPFSLTTEVSKAPWNLDHYLVHIGLQGKSLDLEDIRPSNLVFLIDCSGSMSDTNKLPLLKKAFNILLDQLGEKDKVSIVAYAGAAGLVLPATPATAKKQIMDALDKLEAGGSTAGGEGIQLAYRVAKENLISEGNNRVILATDGDFNVGTSSSADLVRMIEEKRKDDIYLTICGLGMGNYKDGRMEQISNAGNGNYFYIDNIREAQKVFGREMRANMFTIAKDVKMQVEFNPAQVKAYRLIGYENRKLANEDFDDDTKDAGELGAGHTVTALYEIIPANSAETVKKAADLKYQQTSIKETALKSQDLLTLKLRYKPIQSEESILLEHIVTHQVQPLESASVHFRFSSAVAGFGLLLRQSKFKGDLTYDQVIDMARSALGPDSEGDRAEFVRLVEQAKLLDNKTAAGKDGR